MTVGFNEGTTKENSDLATDLQLAEKNGFDSIEFRLDKLEAFLGESSLEDLAGLLSRCRIKAHALNAIKGINLLTGDEAAALLTRLEWACSVGARLGSPSVVLVPTIRDGLDAGRDRRAIDEDCVRILEQCSRVAARFGMGVALEPVGLRGSAVRGLEQAWSIVRSVAAANVGLAVDTFNIHAFDSWNDIDVLRQVPAEKIHVVHIADSESLPLDKLTQANRLWPGDGVVRIADVLTVLDQIGYAGVVSLELFRPEYWRMSPEEVIRIGMEKVRRFVSADAGRAAAAENASATPGRTP